MPKRVYFVCALFLGACSALVEAPQQVLGTRYVLRSIGGITLPAPWAPNPASASLMTADTLELRDDNTGSWKATTLDPGATGPARQLSEFTYARSNNNTISISFRCPDNASCIAPPHFIGTVSATGIVFTESVVSRAPLVFERIP